MSPILEPYLGKESHKSQVALNDMQTFKGISSTLDDIAGLMGSCMIYERIHGCRGLLTSKNVMRQLPYAYAAMLEFTAEAICYSDKRYPCKTHIHYKLLFNNCGS